MKDFKKLNIWQKSHQLTRAIYKMTMTFPREELYGLTSQMRRSSVSIPANIAEGCCRNGDNEFARFLFIAVGSASELEYHLLLAYDLDFLNENSFQRLSSEVHDVKKMITAFIKKLKAER